MWLFCRSNRSSEGDWKTIESGLQWDCSGSWDFFFFFLKKNRNFRYLTKWFSPVSISILVVPVGLLYFFDDASLSLTTVNVCHLPSPHPHPESLLWVFSVNELSPELKIMSGLECMETLVLWEIPFRKPDNLNLINWISWIDKNSAAGGGEHLPLLINW